MILVNYSVKINLKKSIFLGMINYVGGNMVNVVIERNTAIEVEELNELLATNNWGLDSLQKLQRCIDLSWGWVSAKDENGKIIGFVRVLSDGLRHAYICSMIVHPKCRKLGIGTKIMKELMDMLRDSNLYPTLVANPGNEKFYSKFGFEVESKGFTAMCIRKPF